MKTLEQQINEDIALKNELEKAIDERGLSEVLIYLRDICNDKAWHIEANWQDEKLAKQWTKKGQALVKVIQKIGFEI